jgi:hypothetical protein
MSLRGDDRAAAVQVGAVILFGFVVVALASWQAQVVPQQNADVEYDHSQRVQDDMQDVRNGIVSAPGGNRPSSIGVEMGTSYPPRTLFVNPADPSGSIRTLGTENASVNLSLSNVAVANDDARQLWGTEESFDTGGLAYSPRYAVYTGAPDTVYENSVLYNQFDGGETIVLAGQDLVDGERLSLVTLGGELDRSQADTYTVDLDAVSTSGNRVGVTNDSAGTVNVSFATRRSAGWWEDRLSGELTANGGNVVDVVESGSVGAFTVVTVQLRGGVTYDLAMARVTVGDGAADPGAGYLTDPNGDSLTVGEGSTGRVVVEVRDEYNNPVSGVLVNASVESGPGSLADRNLTTDSDGRVAFEYSAPTDGDSTDETARVDVSYTVDPASTAITGSAPENLSVSVVVDDDDAGGGGGGGGAYSIDWQDPDADNPSGPLSNCDDTACTWDVGTDADGDLTLRSVTSPTVEDLDVDFRVNDSTVGTLSTTDTTTGSTGEATTTLSAAANGTIDVFVITPDSSDVVTVEVTNVSGGGGADTTAPTIASATLTDDTDNDGVVNDGDTVTVSADVSDSESGVSSVEADVSDFGGPGALTLTDGDNDGVYDASFTVDGATASADGDYAARITATDGAGNTQQTDTNQLTLDTTAPSVTVGNPNGGETFQGGDTVTITWTADDATSGLTAAPITIEYSTDGGTTWSTIATGEADDGSYDWTVPNTATQDALVRVNATDRAGNVGSDASDNTFRIVGPVDSFEDGDITEYTGDTGAFDVVSGSASDGTFALQASPSGNARKTIESTTGLSSYPRQGDTIQFDFRPDDFGGNQAYLAEFGFGETTGGDRYTVTIQETGGRTNTFELVVSNGGTTVSSTTFSLSTGTYYGVSIVWNSSTVEATVSTSGGTELATASVTSAGDGGGNYVAFTSQGGGTTFDNVRRS